MNGALALDLRDLQLEVVDEPRLKGTSATAIARRAYASYGS
jgi:hypothetical protein